MSDRPHARRAGMVKEFVAPWAETDGEQLPPHAPDLNLEGEWHGHTTHQARYATPRAPMPCTLTCMADVHDFAAV
jgi:hypothetical protein